MAKKADGTPASGTMQNGKIIVLLMVLVATSMCLRAQIYRGADRDELNKGGGKLVQVLEHRMTPKELESFLQKRTSGNMMGSFSDFGSLLWAVYEVGIWSDDKSIGDLPVQSPYPEDYKPTWKEFMDVLARQVECTWRYDPKTGYWVFEKRKIERLFSLKIVEGWNSTDQRSHVVFVPPIAPVGMDVYMMGHYSATNESERDAIYSKARKHVSELFARNFKSDLAGSDFTVETVSGVKALFFTSPAPKHPERIWRQWAFVKDGWCFVIVSVIDKTNESKLLPDVKSMISTFEIAKTK
jgi:hypothetical protein